MRTISFTDEEVKHLRQALQYTISSNNFDIHCMKRKALEDDEVAKKLESIAWDNKILGDIKDKLNPFPNVPPKTKSKWNQ